MTPLAAYIVLFLAVGVGFIFVHLVAGKLIRPSKRHPEKETIYECGEPTIGSAWVQFDLRFYVVALLFVIFDVEVAFFFPWAEVFGKANHLANQPVPTSAAGYRDYGRAVADLASGVTDPERYRHFAGLAEITDRDLEVLATIREEQISGIKRLRSSTLEKLAPGDLEILQKEGVAALAAALARRGVTLDAQEQNDLNSLRSSREQLAAVRDLTDDQKAVLVRLTPRVLTRQGESGPALGSSPVRPGDFEVNRTRARELAWVAFAEILVFFGVLLVGFAYLWRRGDLAWVRSTAAEPPVPAPGRSVGRTLELETVGKSG